MMKYLFPVISLIGHNQEATIIDQITEEVLQGTQFTSNELQQFSTLYYISEEPKMY